MTPPRGPDSYDHDHVVRNLTDRFDAVLDALESEGGWVTNRVTPGKIILGRLGEIETGVRQMIRRTPLATTQIDLPSGQTLTVPTDDETLRIKAFLIVRRNQTRDYLDVAAVGPVPSELAGAGSPQPFREDVQQGGCGMLVQSQHTAVRDVRVQHDDPVLFGHQQVGEASCGVGLAGGHDHAAMATAFAAFGRTGLDSHHLRSVPDQSDVDADTHESVAVFMHRCYGEGAIKF